MPIYASAIARGAVILTECCPSGNNFPAIVRRLVEQIPNQVDTKKSYSYESYNFHYLVEGKITYICMTDQNTGYRIPYAFLFDLNNRFRATYGERIYNAGNLEMNDGFSRVMRERMEFFSNDKNADKITKVKGDIEDAKQVMVKNIDKVLERGAKIEVLVDKTEDLQERATSFKIKGTKLKKKMWWKNAKMCCILACVIAVILVVVILLILWKTGILSDLTSGKPKKGEIKPNNSTETNAVMFALDALLAE